MPTQIVYRGCTIGGNSAGFVTRMKEAMAEAAGRVSTALEGLNAIEANREDEAVTLTGTTPKALSRAIKSVSRVSSGLDSNGVVYRPRSQYAASSRAIGWFKLTESSGTADAVDSSHRNLKADAVGTLPLDTAFGPVGGHLVTPVKPRLFSNGNYFRVNTGAAPPGSSGASGYKLNGTVGAMGWFRIDSLVANQSLVSFSGPDDDLPQSNTLYSLYVTTSGALGLRWHHSDHVLASVTLPSFTAQAGAYFFGGFARTAVQLSGTVSVSGTTVTGADTSFMSEASVDQWVRIGTESTLYQVESVASNGSLELTASHATVTDQTLTTSDVRLFAGNLLGVSQETTFPGQPIPCGGSAGTFYIGRDEQTAWGLNGTVDGLVVISQPLEAGELLQMYKESRPDYLVNDGKLVRTSTSSITSGSEVHVAYVFDTSIATAATNSLGLAAPLDAVLAGSVNPAVTTTQQLSTALGGPDLSRQQDTDYIEERLSSQFGLTVTNGQLFPPGLTDLTSFQALVRALDGDVARARLLVENKPTGSFVLLAYEREVTEHITLNACNLPQTQIVVEDKLAGVNKLLRECAVLVGATTDDLYLKLWWIGAIPAQESSFVRKLRALGLTGVRLLKALGGLGDDQMEVAVIANPQAVEQIVADPAVSADDVDVLLSDRADSSINLAPTSEDVLEALNSVINAPSRNGIEEPALLVAGAVDFPKTFRLGNPEQEIQATIDAVTQAAADAAADIGSAAAEVTCVAITSVLENMIEVVAGSLEAVTKAIVPFTLEINTSVNVAQLSLQVHIPCLVTGSASTGGLAMSDNIGLSLTKLLAFQAEMVATGTAIRSTAESTNYLLCIPETFIQALLGEVCGLKSPDTECSKVDQLKSLLLKLRGLITIVRKILAKLLSALGDIAGSLAFSAGAALSLQAEIPCLAEVSSFLRGVSSGRSPQ